MIAPQNIKTSPYKIVDSVVQCINFADVRHSASIAKMWMQQPLQEGLQKQQQTSAKKD